ncbi:MAG: hypothetical protein RIS29_2109 [Bacteroidota bacterium]|jgi:hypothetical protein
MYNIIFIDKMHFFFSNINVRPKPQIALFSIGLNLKQLCKQISYTYKFKTIPENKTFNTYRNSDISSNNKGCL